MKIIFTLQLEWDSENRFSVQGLNSPHFRFKVSGDINDITPYRGSSLKYMTTKLPIAHTLLTMTRTWTWKRAILWGFDIYMNGVTSLRSRLLNIKCWVKAEADSISNSKQWTCPFKSRKSDYAVDTKVDINVQPQSTHKNAGKYKGFSLCQESSSSTIHIDSYGDYLFAMAIDRQFWLIDELQSLGLFFQQIYARCWLGPANSIQEQKYAHYRALPVLKSSLKFRFLKR